MNKINQVGLFGVAALVAGGLTATHGWSDWDPDLTRTPREAGRYLDHAEVAKMGGVGNYVTPEEVHLYDLKLAQEEKVREDNSVSSFSVIQPSDYRVASREASPEWASQTSSQSASELTSEFPSELKDEGMVFFAPNQSDLTQRGKAELACIAEQLARHPNNTVEVDGYSDSIGTSEDNHDLAQARSLSVKNELIRDGVEASQIQTRAFGDNQPIATNDMPVGRALNRRAEIYVETNPVT